MGWKFSQVPSSGRSSCMAWGTPSSPWVCSLPSCGVGHRWQGCRSFHRDHTEVNIFCWLKMTDSSPKKATLNKKSFTSWLNSQAVEGEEWMTTRLVVGTSRPMDPADVDRSTRASLLIKHALNMQTSVLPIPIAVYHQLLVSSSTVPRKLLMESHWLTVYQLKTLFYPCCIGSKCVQVEIRGSWIEEVTLNKLLVSCEFQIEIFLLAAFSRGFCRKNTWALGNDSSTITGTRKDQKKMDCNLHLWLLHTPAPESYKSVLHIT